MVQDNLLWPKPIKRAQPKSLAYWVEELHDLMPHWIQYGIYNNAAPFKSQHSRWLYSIDINPVVALIVLAASLVYQYSVQYSH